MSELAKSSRKAMQAKAKRLASADPHQKVDSSTWSPAEPLDTEAKTGARPLVKRLYKSGGAVKGMAAKKRGDRMARKSGGRTNESEDRSKRYLTPDNLINRDVRMANDEREGKKHVGAFKKGGRTKHADGKKVPLPPVMPADMKAKRAALAKASAMDDDAAMQSIQNAKALLEQNRQAEQRGIDYNALNRYKNMPLPSDYQPEYKNQPLPNDYVPSYKNMKKGGKAEHPDVAEDKKLIKKMIKPEAMKKADGGKVKWIQKAIKNKGALHKQLGVPEDKKIPERKLEKAAAKPGKLGQRARLAQTLRGMHADGGSVFSGNSTTKIPGVVGGRKAHAKGGKAKGKTNISINIMPQAGGAPMPPMGMKPPMPPIAPPMAPPAGAPPMGGAPTDPALLAALAGGMKGGPAPMPAPMPMPRKSGGRTTHVIDHAAGGGLGRLEKIKAYGESQKPLR
jgi:hypothetical protein